MIIVVVGSENVIVAIHLMIIFSSGLHIGHLENCDPHSKGLFFCVYGYMYMYRRVTMWINMTWFAQSECYAYRTSSKYTTGNSYQLFINESIVIFIQPFYHIQADSVADMRNGLSFPVEITKCNIMGFYNAYQSDRLTALYQLVSFLAQNQRLRTSAASAEILSIR